VPRRNRGRHAQHASGERDFPGCAALSDVVACPPGFDLVGRFT
jgi:hypothetical protein